MALSVVFYESGPDALALIPVHYPAHRERVDEFAARGELLLVGTFGDPIAEGAMAVFRTAAGAEEFVAGDPFVLHGVVGSWYRRDWHEVLNDF